MFVLNVLEKSTRFFIYKKSYRQAIKNIIKIFYAVRTSKISSRIYLTKGKWWCICTNPLGGFEDKFLIKKLFFHNFTAKLHFLQKIKKSFFSFEKKL